MLLIRDLGLKQCGKYRKRYAIFECSECKSHFETRMETVRARKQEMCNSCASKLKRATIIHGKRKTSLNTIVNNMIQRCENPKASYYYAYGARGISVCDEWRNNRSAFFKWAEENGYSEGLSIERTNVDLNYCPSNCIFIKKEEQALNTSRSIKNRFDKETLKMIQDEYNSTRVSMQILGKKYGLSRPSIAKILKSELASMIEEVLK